MTVFEFEAGLVGLSDIRERIGRWLACTESHRQSEVEIQESRLEGLRQEALATGYALGVAHCDRLLAWFHYDRSDLDAALALFRHARELYVEAREEGNEINAMNGIAACLASRSEYDLALDVYRDAMILAERTDNEAMRSRITGNIGITLLELGAADEAIEYLRSSLAASQPPLNEAILELKLGEALEEIGRRVEGEAEMEAALAISEREGADPTTAETEASLGHLRLHRGDLDRAEASFARALPMARAGGLAQVEGTICHGLGKIAARRGETENAARWFEEGMKAARRQNFTPLEADVARSYGDLLKNAGRWDEAFHLAERRHAIEMEQTSARLGRQLSQIKALEAKKEAELYRALFDKISAIGEIGRMITASLDFDAMLPHLYEHVRKVMACDLFGMGLYDRSRDEIDFRLSVEGGRLIPPKSLPLSASSFSSRCINTGADMMINEVESEYSRYLPVKPPDIGFDGRSANSMLFIPLQAEGETLGTAYVQSYEPKAYKADDLETLRALGAYLSIALRNSRLFSEVRRLATEDTLTGAVNRRQLFLLGETAFQGWKRYGGKLALIMMDLDRFKRVNDSHGHQVGDQVLRMLGSLVLEKKRSTDVFARYGGEEFLIVSPSTDLDGALLLAERIREAFAAVVIPVSTSLHCTISLGVTDARKDDESFEDLIGRADRALYEAKHKGRNKCCAS